MGVEEEEEVAEQPEASGVVGRALHSLEELMRDTYYSTSILVALFLLRECAAAQPLAAAACLAGKRRAARGTWAPSRHHGAAASATLVPLLMPCFRRLP